MFNVKNVRTDRDVNGTGNESMNDNDRSDDNEKDKVMTVIILILKGMTQLILE